MSSTPNRAYAALLLAGAGFALIAALLLTDAAAYPWAHSFTGGPTLTGDWKGQLTTANGTRFDVSLRLAHRRSGSKCSQCPTIEGAMRICETGGAPRSIDVWGRTEDWRGTRLYLKVRDDGAPDKLTVGEMSGAWAGETITMTAQLRVPGAPVRIGSSSELAGAENVVIAGGHPDAPAPVSWRLLRHAGTHPDGGCSLS
jgi:hypothetical protein